jgi:quinol monooxygenase YgiN
MATLYVHHKVKNYATWRKVFDDLTAMRTGHGCTGHKVFQAPGDPNEITILTDWKTIDNAREYATSEDLKNGMKDAGVISQPDVAFLAEA